MSSDSESDEDATPAEYNLASPPSLLVAGLRLGAPICLVPSTIEPLDDSGRGIFTGSLYGAHAEDVVRGGEKGRVAIKRVEDGRARVPRNVRREARLLAKIDHPNVLPLLNAYLIPRLSPAGSDAFLLFSPLYPSTLATLLSFPRFIFTSPDFSLVAHSLAWQMLSGVAHLHSLSPPIAHRDISPANFALARDGRVVLIDFGISIESGDEPPGAMHFEVGTGPYRAPELLFTARTYDPPALDLWALGATLAELFRPIVAPPPPTDDSDSDPEDADEGRWVEREMRALDRSPSPLPPERATLFVGTASDFALIGSIFKVIGTPTLSTWPEAAALPDFGHFSFVEFHPTPILSHLPHLAPESPLVPVLEGLLKCSARERVLRRDEAAWASLVDLPEGVASFEGRERKGRLGKVLEKFLS